MRNCLSWLHHLQVCGSNPMLSKSNLQSTLHYAVFILFWYIIPSLSLKGQHSSMEETLVSAKFHKWERRKKKFHSWRLVFLKSVFSVIPFYYMSFYWLSQWLSTGLIRLGVPVQTSWDSEWLPRSITHTHKQRIKREHKI